MGKQKGFHAREDFKGITARTIWQGHDIRMPSFVEFEHGSARNPFYRTTKNSKMKNILIVYFLLFLPYAGIAQENINYPDVKTSLGVKKVSGKILLDGVLSEADWYAAETIGNFFRLYPSDTSFAKNKTFIKATYDNSYLYFGIVALQQNDSRFLNFPADSTFDVITIKIGPFNDHNQSFYFVVSQLGTGHKTSSFKNGFEAGKYEPDNTWTFEVNNYDNYWVAEIAIPFKTLCRKIQNPWRINFIRTNVPDNEQSAWIKIAANFSANDKMQIGAMNFENEPGKTSKNSSKIWFHR